MSDCYIATFCNACNSNGIRTSSTKYSFPKRLLVALSLFAILMMCAMPVESRAVEHRRRHQRRQPENMAQLTKEPSLKRPKNPTVEHYKNATRKIMKKLKNTRRFFNQDRKVLNESREYRDGMPDWLPAVNFVDIHYHDYKSTRKVGGSIWERKFAYQMPRLHKSLKEYEVIFQLLRDVDLDFPDDPFNDYKIVRQRLISNSLQKLYSSIAEIAESMAEVNMSVHKFDKSKMKLDSFPKKVDATQCLKNDYIAFRGYGNLLNNWYYEFRCPRSKKPNRQCAAYEEKLKEKKDNRKPKSRNTFITS